MKTKTSIYHRTFAFAYVLLVAVIFYGCEVPKDNNREMNDPNIRIIVVDSCEYIIYAEKVYKGGMGGICHKQNCKFCAERSKK